MRFLSFLLLLSSLLFSVSLKITTTMSMQELNKLTASDGESQDYFGVSVSMSGDTVVVGAYGDYDIAFDSGSAYIYERDSITGLFLQVAKLTASDGAADDQFGGSVAISGDTVVVGAYATDDNIGSAYLYEKPNGGWVDSNQETAKLTDSDGAANDTFGSSVAVSSDTVVVGARGDDDSGSASGSAYLYEKPLSGWVDSNQTVKLTASDIALGDNFGYSVAISGDTVVVAALADDDMGSNSGSAYLYEKPLSGWINATQNAKFTASDGAANDSFGASVAVSGDIVVIGANRDDDMGSESGSAYLYEKPLSGWINATQNAKFTASDGVANDSFGRSVAVSGDVVVIGATNYDNIGSAYLYEKPLSGWVNATQSAKLTASDGEEGDYFGISVAMSGDTVVVGAFYDDIDTLGDGAGSAYIFKAKPRAVNMAPIIAYLLSNTVSMTANNFTMTLDVNKSTETGDWKVLSSVSDTEATVSVKSQGTYGTFTVTGDSVIYDKTTETNATDSGVLEITNGTNTVEVTVTLNSLYWKQVSAGDDHTVAIKSDGTLWAWGRNNYGQLGDNTNISKSVPTQEVTGATNWSTVSAGHSYTMAIKSDGTLWAWGDNHYGQLGDGTTNDKWIPTQEVTGSTAWGIISAGYTHAVAIKSDGSLWGWGYNGKGQLGDGTTGHKSVPTQEFTESTNWSTVNAGVDHTMAIKSDGTLWGWGENDYGELGDGTTDERWVPTQEDTNATDWSTVSAGSYYTAAIKSDGTLWAWGYNYNGQLGDGTNISKSVPTQEITGATDWITVSAGRDYTIAIKSDGTLWAWGSNTYGQLGDGTTTRRLVPTQEDTNATDWSTVSMGISSSIAIKSDGTLWAWGSNTYGQLGDGTTTDSLIPIPIQRRPISTLVASDFIMTLDVNKSTETGDWKVLSSVSDTEATASVKTQGAYGTFVVTGDSLSYLKTTETNATDSGVLKITDGRGTVEITMTLNSLYWKQITTGGDHTVAIKSDGTLWAWGDNSAGQLGDGTTDEKLVPTQEFTKATDWVVVSADYHTVAIKSDGTLWAWGSNYNGRLGDGTTDEKLVPTQEFTKATDWITVSAGSRHTVAIKSNGTLWAWGRNSYGQLGDGTTDEKLVPTPEVNGATDWSTVSAGNNHTVAIKFNSTLWAWGSNSSGQLGDGTTENKLVPTQEFTGASDWSSVSAGGSHTAAIKSNGTLLAWGSNSSGQLGDGTTENKLVPTQEFTEATNWRTLNVGTSNIVAIKSDSTLWAWGSNSNGQLGDGTTDSKLIPTQEISGAINWSSVSVGGDFTISIKSDGTLWGWGCNTYGQLGDGTTDGKLLPTQEITGATDWSIVSVKSSHTVAIKSDGTLWAWGDNTYGELGDGTTDDRWVPTQEATGATDWSIISVGIEHTIAIKSDGTLWAWGDNPYGQLGDGTTTDKLIPTQEFTKATDWVSVSVGYSHTVAIKSDGTLWVWGLNESGELGDGTTTNRSVPAQEATEATNWISVNTGQHHTIAIKSDNTLWGWGRNSGILGDGTSDNKLVPTQEFSGATNWISVSTYFHTAAIKSDGTLWTWGGNYAGELGDGTTTTRLVPTQEATGATDWSTVRVGNNFTVAIKSSGTLWAWGYNGSGQLGDGTTINRLVPTQEFTGASDWHSVFVGNITSYAIATKSDNTLWGWGRGSLGEGTTNEKLTPTQEATGSTNWSIVSVENHAAAIKSDSSIWTWGYNASGQLGVGLVWIPTLTQPRQP